MRANKRVLNIRITNNKILKLIWMMKKRSQMILKSVKCKRKSQSK